MNDELAFQLIKVLLLFLRVQVPDDAEAFDRRESGPHVIWLGGGCLANPIMSQEDIYNILCSFMAACNQVFPEKFQPYSVDVYPHPNRSRASVFISIYQ